MDYKKKYREFLEKLKELQKDWRSTHNRAADEVDKLLSEFKENDNERIKEALIEYFRWNVQQILCDFDNKEVLAWLEKQGEQKLVQETEPTPIFRIGDILKRKGKDYTFRVDRILGGYYHCDRNNGAFFPIEEQGNWELVEQKPAWSEEDDIMVHDIDYALRCQITYSKSRLSSMSSWIYELRDRVQPNKEWKITDEDMFRAAVWHIKNSISKGNPDTIIESDILNWFNSLKYRIQPKPKWNPSDEQMEYLLTIKTLSPSPLLESLYIDLKKLREE